MKVLLVGVGGVGEAIADDRKAAQVARTDGACRLQRQTRQRKCKRNLGQKQAISC